MTIDLTEEMMTPAVAVAIGYGLLAEGDAIDLAWDTVRAAFPLIEAAVRDQIAAERRVVDRFPAIVETYGAELTTLRSEPAAVIGRALVSAARTVRGEQR